MTSQRTLKQFYQRFKEEYTLLLVNSRDDSLHVTMDVIRLMYAYFLQYGAGLEQRALLKLNVRPEFARISAFFDKYQWRLDDQQDEYCIQPDVLGYVFEQQINQKQMGVYYTHRDVAEYIAQKTILPYLLDVVTRAHSAIVSPLQARLLRTQPERYIHTAVSSTTYLPTETESEYATRQVCYQQLYKLLQQGQICTVADMVTHNLDIRRFVLDIIETCEHPVLLLTFYRTLACLTILDPTCGTGAFLLAAMTLLEELYEACLHHMQQYIERWNEECKTDNACDATFRAILTQITPLVNNLYGIEIMQEAVEVCTMRLSLAAITQNVDNVITVVVCQSTFGTETRASPCGRPCPSHIKIDRLVGTDGSRPQSILIGQKDVIHRSLQWNIYSGNVLADETRQRAFPKHIGNFDVIIGNPPFVEYSKFEHDTPSNDGNGTYGNLYAEIIEHVLTRCCTARSYIGFVVPLSICGGERFDTLRRTILTHTSILWLANFDIFPCRLFESAYQRLTLLLGKRNEQIVSPHETYVTHIQRWYTSERSTLMRRIVYTQVRYRHREGVFPKCGSPRQEEIVQKMIVGAGKSTLSMLVSPRRTEYAVYYQEATNMWMKATRHVPYYKKNGVVTRPRHGRFLYFEDESRASIVCALMNSSLFYLWFATYSDGFHLSHALVQNFPVLGILCIDEQLLSLARYLEEDIQKHALYSTRNTKTGDRIEIEEYRVVYSKSIVDKIDCILAQHYGFTNEELDFILYYDFKYRVGKV